MSVQLAKAFLQRVRTDEVYSKQLQACQTVGQFLEMAAKGGFYFMPEELSKADGNLEKWIAEGAGVWGHSIIGKSACVDYTKPMG